MQFMKETTERHAILSWVMVLEEDQGLKEKLGRGLRPDAFDRFGEHVWRDFGQWLETEGREFRPYC